jgi:hypothetical protein
MNHLAGRLLETSRMHKWISVRDEISQGPKAKIENIFNFNQSTEVPMEVLNNACQSLTYY